MFNLPLPAVAVWLSCALIAAVTGCGDGAAGNSEISVRDSAGVRIVELAVNPFTAPPYAHIDTSATLRIRPVLDNPATLFGDVRGAQQLSDGRIAVLDSPSNEIRIFSATGEFLHKIGRAGTGPGEMARASMLFMDRMDTLQVYEVDRRLFTVFNPDGVMVRQFRLPDELSRTSSAPVGVHPDGSFLLGKYDGVPPQADVGRYHATTTILHLDRTGTSMRELGTHSRGMVTRYTMTNGYPDAATSVFAPTPIHTPTAEGYVWAYPVDFEFQLWGRDGKHMQTVRAAEPRTRVSGAELEERRSALVDKPNVPHPDVRIMLRDNFNAADKPEYLPGFSQLVVDSRDYIWVREYFWKPQEGDLTWSVFRPDGHPLGTVQLPSQLTVFQIGADFILGREPDQDGAHTIVRYRLRR